MDVVPLRLLRPYELSKKIRVRICRMWKTKDFGSDAQIASLEFVFVDAQNDDIQASANARDSDFFSAKLEPGGAYEISDFYIVDNRRSSKVVPHIACLRLTRRTTIKILERVQPAIPRHCFHLIDYQQLPSRIDRNEYLTDVLGRVAAIQALEEMFIKNYNRHESKREIILENIRRERVKVTLWSDAARTFDDQALLLLPLPVFIVVTGLRVKQFQAKAVLSSTNSTLCFFNPEMQELEFYKIAFAGVTEPILKLPSSGTTHIGSQQLREFNRKTVKELHLLNPDLNMDTNFTCRATVVGFDLRRGWWYKGCPSCLKQVRSIDGTPTCPSHGIIDRAPLPLFKLDLIVQDDTEQANFLIIGKPAEAFLGVSCHVLVVEQGYEDPFSLPPAIARVKGQSKIFQLRFGNLKYDFSRTDILISNVFEEDLLIEQAHHTPTKKLLNVETKAVLPENLSPATPALPPIINVTTPITAPSAGLKSPGRVKSSAAVKRVLFNAITKAKRQVKSKKEPILVVHPQDIPSNETAVTARPVETAEHIEPDMDELPLISFKTKAASTKQKKSIQTQDDKKADKQPHDTTDESTPDP